MNQNGKKEFHHNEFNKYKNDIRKTWDTWKEVINKKIFKSDFLSSFVHEDVEIRGIKYRWQMQWIFYWNRAQSGSINTANKAQFNSYLITPCAALFKFAYTNQDNIAKIIRNLRPKYGADSYNISTKLLKEIEDVVSCPWAL